MITPSEEVIDEARDIANRLGVRILPDGAIGIWSEDAESKQLQSVLAVLGLDKCLVRHLDDAPAIPARFKLRRKVDAKGFLFDEWYAGQMNAMFKKEGKLGEQAHLTAKTVAHILVECEGKC